MTNREEEILSLIRENPLISQNEIADVLKITRSSVGVHIGNLIKKGYILGRGYVVQNGSFVTVLGGSNVDIVGFSYADLKLHDSNPGSIKFSLGGVGRNIGENLARMGVETKLISVLGDDMYGKRILEDGRSVGLDASQSLILSGHATSTYMSVLDNEGDMKIAISSMDIYDRMTIEFIKSKKSIIENSKICVIDTNIPSDVIEYVLNNFKGTKFFLDTVSSKKSLKVREMIGKFHTIKPNRIEAEILSGIKIESEEDLEKVGEYFIKSGVKKVFISLGAEGVYYNTGKSSGIYKPKPVKMVNANGAGDAFVAGLVYSELNEFNELNTMEFACACSALAITYKDTINPNISLENIYRIMEENISC